MKRLVAIVVLASICVLAGAAEPQELTKEQVRTLRWALAALTASLARVLIAVEETEEIGPTLRAEINDALSACLAILDVLGFRPDPKTSVSR